MPKVFKSEHVVVNRIATMGFTCVQFIMGRNIKLMQSRFIMEKIKFCNGKCDNEIDVARLSVQVRELCEWRYKCDFTFLHKIECTTVIDFFMYYLKFNCLLLFKVSHFIVNKAGQTNKLTITCLLLIHLHTTSTF